MALSIKDTEADALARELAKATGESLTEAVTVALRERLLRVRGRRRGSALLDDIREIQEMVARAPILDDRTAEEIIGYDEHGLPR